MRLRRKVLQALIAFTRIFGTKLRDADGKVLCKAFLFPWGGQIQIIGLPNHVHLRPAATPQGRLSYWRQVIGWDEAAPPDFPRIGISPPFQHTTPKTCHVVICHIPPQATEAVFRSWQFQEPSSLVLIAYGGTEEDFRLLPDGVNAMYVADPALRTTDHVRQRQQYQGVFRKASEWLAERGHDITHVNVVEFDVVPAVANVGNHLCAALLTEDADMIGYGMVDMSDTVHPHHRHQLNDTAFPGFLRTFSQRENPTRLLCMLGCCSFWTRNAFEKVANLEDIPAVYLEIGMPTLAHHLGFRVRPVPAAQEKFVTFEGDYTGMIDEFRQQGAWLVHPCKAVPTLPQENFSGPLPIPDAGD